ncbi:MAG: RrF2 family transcriptional regulator [Myxococcota bacterium]
MMRLSKKADYGLVALKALGSLAPNDSMSARELAMRNHLPLDLTPKVLAKLAQAGLVEATMGKSGGYRLLRDLSQITVAEVVRVLDGESQFVSCQEGDGACHRFAQCDIRSPLDTLNREVMKVLDRMTIAQL